MKKSWAPRLAAILVLFVVPLALRLLPIEHGGERNYVPDTHIVRAALGMAKDHDLIPPVGKYSHYPNLLPYMLLPIYGVQFLLGVATHAWGSIQQFGEHVLAHPQTAAWPARALIAVFGALTAWVVYRGARAAGLKQGAWVAAWLVGTGLLDVQFSTHERPWAPMVFFMAASAWAAIEYGKTASWRPLAWSGALAGLAFATHQGGAGALAIPGLAWAFSPLGYKNARALQTRLWHGLLAVALFGVIALLLGHPYWLRYGSTRMDQVIGGEAVEEQAGGFHIGGMSIVFEVRWESLARLSKVIFGYDPVVIVLGLAGLVFALRDRRWRAIAVFTVLWAAFFLTNRSDHVRYLLPVTVFLAWPAGLVAERWMSRPFGMPALALLLAFPLVQALRFDALLCAGDTREAAERALARLPAGTCTAIDRYGPEVDLDTASIYRLGMLRNTQKQPLRAREEFRKRQLDAGADVPKGVNAVRVEELFEVDERTGKVTVKSGLEGLGTDPRSVLASLGVTHFLLVDRRPGDGSPHLLADVLRGSKPDLTIDPSRDGVLTKEAFLPTEMDFPLTGLWSVDRAGPWLGLYALK
jgi:hypothetical protein